MAVSNSFWGGVHPTEGIGGKTATSGTPIQDAQPPEQVAILLGQSVGAPCVPLVKLGDLVKIGQKIGEPPGFVGAPIHASVSGKVLGIQPRPNAAGMIAQAIVIENDGRDDWVDLTAKDPDKLSSEELVSAIREAGLVGLGGAAFPTAVKLSPPKDKHIDIVILNGAECEPYLSCDHRIMLECADQVIDGLLIVKKILGAERACIGIESNKPDAIEKLKLAALGKNIEIISLPVMYPQGGEKQLIQSITGRQVPSGKLPMDVGCVVDNVSTAVAISEAIRLGKPLVERAITIAGAIDQPKNLRVRVGESIGHLIDQCGALRPTVNKVILGGPMMGLCAVGLNVPVVKASSGVLLFEDNSVPGRPMQNCIRCAKCATHCPIRLQPMMLYALTNRERYDEAKQAHAMDCIECGCCSFICPAKLPLVQTIRVCKREIQKRTAAKKNI